MQKNIIKIVSFLILFTLSTVSISAGGLDFDTNTGLRPIEIPLFSSSALDFVENASVISWLAFVGSVFTVAIIAFWILRILVSGVDALRSEGDATKLQVAYTKIKSNFIGMFITFLIPLILSLVGAFFGIGSVLQWPESFQLCQNTEYRFYFEAYIKAGNEADAKNACGIS